MGLHFPVYRIMSEKSSSLIHASAFYLLTDVNEASGPHGFLAA